MRIYTPAGDLAFKTFNFPDGQPHFQLMTYEREFGSVSIELAIRNPSDLFMLLLANAVLRQHGYAEVHVDIRYLMGARMDRAISTMEPFSLALVAQLINGAGFTKVRLLDVHSEAATRLIRNSENLLPEQVVIQVLNTIGLDVRVVCPDKGAQVRTYARTRTQGKLIAYCEKKRDLATGGLSGFKVNDPDQVKDQNCLIVDDICDGGGTFVGLAKELRKAGAKKVFLYVTHKVQHQSTLEGIDTIFTTDSYDNKHVGGDVVVVPISMEKLK